MKIADLKIDQFEDLMMKIAEIADLNPDKVFVGFLF